MYRAFFESPPERIVICHSKIKKPPVRRRLIACVSKSMRSVVNFPQRKWDGGGDPMGYRGHMGQLLLTSEWNGVSYFVIDQWMEWGKLFSDKATPWWHHGASSFHFLAKTDETFSASPMACHDKDVSLHFAEQSVEAPLILWSLGDLGPNFVTLGLAQN